ncbi:MAG: type I secretion system permease/ATPase [Hyphomicrobiales bacterium]|nr:MAG: type I secretion system permease/ATPase [Hyphomicrobiales bacterium]
MARARGAFIAVGVFSGLVNVLSLTGSMYMLQVYDRVVPSQSVPSLVGFTILLVLLYAAYGALDHVRVKVLSRVGVAIDRALRPAVIEAVMTLPIRARAGLEGVAPVRDLDQIRSFLSSLGPTALFDMPWLPLYLALVYMLHPMLGHFALAGALLLIAMAWLTERKTKAPSREAAATSAARVAFAEAARRNAEVIRAMGFTQRMQARWDTLNERFVAAQLGLSDASTSIGSVAKVLRMLLQSGTLGLGAYLAINGELSAGSIIAASIVTARALAPIELAIAHWKGFVAARQSAERLDVILQAAAAEEAKMPLPAPSSTLSVQGLAVAPPRAQAPVIADITFALQKGDGLGIIGPSASGKSTLARALVGAWVPVPRGGSVRLDGASLDQWSVAALGRHIGYLPQDIELFDGTIAENIARLDGEAPPDTIIDAARAAGIHDMIVHLPEGYGTRIGEGGMRLSGGQRQLVGLARALYGNPFLVVLDEPNSNLDSVGDGFLARAIQSVRERGGIAIVIAHRAAALGTVNKVLALQGGRMMAFGPRDEVLQKITRPHGVPTSEAGASVPMKLVAPARG